MKLLIFYLVLVATMLYGVVRISERNADRTLYIAECVSESPYAGTYRATWDANIDRCDAEFEAAR